MAVSKFDYSVGLKVEGVEATECYRDTSEALVMIMWLHCSDVCCHKYNTCHNTCKTFLDTCEWDDLT